ncbi:hypothetical protein MHU86_10075 [Fragilaria crotonensis]|nr:hypothetical protein MHU86_10075 [Fragilaria crotonensis]
MYLEAIFKYLQDEHMDKKSLHFQMRKNGSSSQRVMTHLGSLMVLIAGCSLACLPISCQTTALWSSVRST